MSIQFMNNIISISAKRHGKTEKLKHVVELVLARGQSLIVGTNYPEQRYKEFSTMFPNAKLEIVKFGVKICKKK